MTSGSLWRVWRRNWRASTALKRRSCSRRHDAVVTGGNANQVVVLPKLDKVIGHLEVVDVIAGGSDGSLRADGTIEVEIQAITGATNETGFGHLTAKGY